MCLSVGSNWCLARSVLRWLHLVLVQTTLNLKPVAVFRLKLIIKSRTLGLVAWAVNQDGICGEYTDCMPAKSTYNSTKKVYEWGAA